MGYYLKPLSDEQYAVCHKKFEKVSSQQSLILKTLSARIRGPESLRLLSLGAGNGMLDIPLLENLQNRYRIQYQGVEPSGFQANIFKKALKASTIENQGSLEILMQTFENYDQRQKFNVILAIHSFYYMQDINVAFEKMVDLLEKDGTIFIAMAPLGPMNEISRKFWHKNQKTKLWFASDLEDLIRDKSLNAKIHPINAKLRLPTTLSQCDPDILSFFLHSDFGAFDCEQQKKLYADIASISEKINDYYFVPHPVTIYEIKP